MNEDDDLTDLERRTFAFDGDERAVYVIGHGPAVIVMPEMPGISPDVARFARWVADAGLTAWVRSLSGVDGAHPATDPGREIMRRACASARFRAFAGGGTSPVVTWLRAIGYRFAGDRWCTAQRLAAYAALLGDRFTGRVLPDEAANPDPPPFFRDLVVTPHSVVTAHLVDVAGHPTVRARDEILAFLTGRLR